MAHLEGVVFSKSRNGPFRGSHISCGLRPTARPDSSRRTENDAVTCVRIETLVSEDKQEIEVDYSAGRTLRLIDRLASRVGRGLSESTILLTNHCRATGTLWHKITRVPQSSCYNLKLTDVDSIPSQRGRVFAFECNPFLTPSSQLFVW